MSARMKFARAAFSTGLVAAAVLNLGALPAKADLISITSFGFAANGDVISITPFDPALGTLDRVNVSVSGTFDVLTLPPANIVQATPIPYSFTISASQSFAPLFAGRGFDTTLAPSFIQPGNLALGLGGVQPVAIPFDDSFTFTAASDLVGFTATTAGGLISGRRSGFLPSISPPGLPIEEVITESAMFVSGELPVQVVNVTPAGAGFITYAYTPATALPEPASVGTFGFGIVLLLASRRSRHTRRSLI